MPPEVQTILDAIKEAGNVTYPGALLIISFLYRDTIRNIINAFINKKGGNGNDLHKKVKNVEKTINNDLTHSITRLEKRLDNIEKKQDVNQRDLTDVISKVSKIEGRLNGR